MNEIERIFITFVDESHELLQEIPVELRKLWFSSFQHDETKHILHLGMERIFKNPLKQQGEFLEVLTVEVADIDSLLEWQEDHPDQEFTAIEPYHAFFDGVDSEGRFMLSLGDIDTKTNQFIPEFEIFLQVQDQMLFVDFQDDSLPYLITDRWIKIITKEL